MHHTIATRLRGAHDDDEAVRNQNKRSRTRTRSRYARSVLITRERGRDAVPVVIATIAVGMFVLVALGYALVVLAIAIVVPILGCIIVRPQRGILLLALGIPFVGVLPILGTPPWALGWKEALTGFVVLATIACPKSARASSVRTRPGWTPALIGFVLVGVASAAWKHDLEALIGLKINYFYVLVAIAVWRCPLDRRERDRLVSILMGTAVLTAIVGIGQELVGADALVRLGYEYNTTVRFAGGYLRAFSTFQLPFNFSLYLMLVLLIGIPVCLSDVTRPRNRAFLLMTPVIVAGMLVSFVRAGMLGLGIGLLYLGIRRYRVLLLGLPLALVAALSLGVLGGSATTFFRSGGSLAEREQGWTENLSQIALHPLGVGIGVAGAAGEKAEALRQSDVIAYQPDNYYFKTIYELGVLGLWMFLLLLIAAIACTHVAAGRAPPRDRPFFDGVAASMVAAFAVSMVATYFEIFPLDVLFWLLLGVTAATEAERAAVAEQGTDVVG